MCGIRQVTLVAGARMTVYVGVVWGMWRKSVCMSRVNHLPVGHVCTVISVVVAPITWSMAPSYPSSTSSNGRYIYLLCASYE